DLLLVFRPLADYFLTWIGLLGCWAFTIPAVWRFLFFIQQGQEATMKKLLSFKDQHHLEAAQGWLGLGNWKEANEELENISSQNRTHLEVLFVRFKINSVARKWEGAYE